MHHHGTGMWLLNRADYAQWKAGSTHALWLYGIPGCGKTILSSAVIEDLQSSRSRRAVVLYFYFDFNDSSKQTFEKMIRSLIFQLYQQNEASRKDVEQLMSSCSNGNEQPKTQKLASMLQRLTDAAGGAHIVLDALDECTSRKDLLSWLGSPTVRQRCLLTSRKEQDIESSLIKMEPTVEIIPIEQSPIDEDIRAVVQHTISNDEDLSRWKKMPEIRDLIENKLMEKAKGMPVVSPSCYRSAYRR